MKKTGFTLIELLVVVLIIGILTAIALPQYNVAVEKARLARVIPMVKTLKDSAEVYFLANGRYDDAAAGTAIEDLPGCTIGRVGHVNCKDAWFNMLTNAPSLYNVGGYSGTEGQARTGYQMGLDQGPEKGRIYCLASAGDDVANKVCTSMGGVFYRTGNEEGMKGSSVKVYRLQ